MRNPPSDEQQDRTPSTRVAAVAKAVDLMEELGGGQTRTVAELAEATGVTRGAAYRILETLESRGWVMRHGSVRRYAIGPAPLALGAVNPLVDELLPIGRAYLRRLWEGFGETVNLGMRMGARILYVDTIESPQRLRTTSHAGTTDPLHSTALGKAILACSADEDVPRELGPRGLAARTPETRATMPSLLADLARTRARGFAIDDEENEIGSRCVAAAVLDVDGRPVAALSVSAPTMRLDAVRMEQIGRELVRCCDEFGAELAAAARALEGPLDRSEAEAGAR